MRKEIEYSLNGTEYIPLIALLKAVHAVSSGGEAQRVVEAGMVRRNGEPESRKRAKLRAGDTIEFSDWRISIVE